MLIEFEKDTRKKNYILSANIRSDKKKQENNTWRPSALSPFSLEPMLSLVKQGQNIKYKSATETVCVLNHCWNKVSRLDVSKTKMYFQIKDTSPPSSQTKINSKQQVNIYSVHLVWGADQFDNQDETFRSWLSILLSVVKTLVWLINNTIDLSIRSILFL